MTTEKEQAPTKPSTNKAKGQLSRLLYDHQQVLKSVMQSEDVLHAKALKLINYSHQNRVRKRYLLSQNYDRYLLSPDCKVSYQKQ